MSKIVCALIIMALAGVPCIAADNPTVALEADSVPIAAAMADLSEQSGAAILCDTDVSASVTGHFASIQLEKLLDSITAVAELKWQKLYLPIEEGSQPTLAQAKAGAAAFKSVTVGSAAIYDPATGTQRVLVEQDPGKPSVEPGKLGLTPVYLITKPQTETPQPVAADNEITTRYQSLETERLQLLAQMTPQQRIAATQAEMVAMMSLDPTVRREMMMDQMRARREMDPQTREAYQSMMRDTFQGMRGGRGEFTPREGGRERGQNRGDSDRGDFGRRSRPPQ